MTQMLPFFRASLSVLAVMLSLALAPAESRAQQASPPASRQSLVPDSTGLGASGSMSILPQVGLSRGDEDYELPIQLLLLLTVLSLAPALVILMTSFTRLVIIFGILRQALGTQQSPPSQVIIGLALFLTFYIMYPVFDTINKEALQPYMAAEMGQKEALDRAAVPMKQFMLTQTREKDLLLFMDLASIQSFSSPSETPLHVLVPAFVISELRIAFQIGFMIFLPFLIIDLVVASVLMSMGMMMLPPVMISLPIKLLLFVLADGWYLIVESIVRGYTTL